MRRADLQSLQQQIPNHSTVCLLDVSKSFDRVSHDKLFSILIARHLAAIVVRIIVECYSKHELCVKWNTVTSKWFKAANGVKQGGIMSPTLFCIYIDILLERLREHPAGCRIGSKYFGAIAYADDVTLLCPSVEGLKSMLTVCIKYGADFEVRFNPAKTVYIWFGSHDCGNTELKINGDKIKMKERAKHLGNIITKNLMDTDDIMFKRGTFIQNVNRLISNFGSLQTSVVMKLLNSYCMAWYGSQIWDLSGAHIQKVCTSWNKAVRKIWHLPYRTHCSLLPHLMQTINMNSELVCRYVKLYDNMCKCKNINVNFIAKYAKYNVHGPLGRNYVQVYLNEGIEMENENARRKIRTKMFNNLVDDGDDDVNMSATVHQIVELCAWRGERVYRPHDHNNFNEEEIDALIEFGFKPDHATTQCTFVVKETIQYYLNGGSQVYTMLLDASQAFDRVNYVTLFNILLKRGLCPLVCRLLAMIYTCQSARIKWGETFSKEFSITNGVKQGGVLSPVLFSIYMDELFVSLYASKVGCHIGQQFMGAFGYADDVILLAPTKRSLYSLLDICIAFSLKYQVKFNSQKSKLIVFNNGNNEEQKSIVFNGQVIDAQLHDVHLGHIIGNNTCDLSIQHSKDDLIRRVNVLLSNFRNVYIDIKYRLFKTFCMSLYGCLLWDLSSNSVNMINIAWRKCIRRLFGLPPRTHNALIHAICNDIPIDGQIHIRFLKFMKGCLLSSNPCIQLCARLAIDGSNSDACKSVNFICSKYDINKYIIPTVSYRDSICTYFSCTEDYSVSAGAICDLCYIRDHIIHTTNFDIYEVEYMIDYLCLS